MIRVMITGANGFVGSYLVNELSKQYDVIAAVRSEEKVLNAAETRKIPSLESDSDWSGLLQDIDIIVHLAARVHVMQETSRDPLSSFLEVNAEGTKRLAQAAVEQGVQKFIFISSIKVNGEGDSDKPYTEKDSPAPVDPYGISKWEAEKYLSSIEDKSRLRVVVLRSPVVYGPGVKGNILRIAKLVRLPIPLPFGKVNNRRTMLSLDNFLRWVERAMTSDDTHQNPVLMGDPRPISTKELVTELGAGMGRRLFLIPVPVNLMERVAELIGKSVIAQRLFSNLEVEPSFDTFPGILDELDDPRESVRKLGREMVR